MGEGWGDNNTVKRIRGGEGESVVVGGAGGVCDDGGGVGAGCGAAGSSGSGCGGGGVVATLLLLMILLLLCWCWCLLYWCLCGADACVGVPAGGM